MTVCLMMQICAYSNSSLVSAIPIEDDDGGDEIDGTLIAGLVIGFMILIFCCAGVLWIVRKKRKAEVEDEDEDEAGSFFEVIKGTGQRIAFQSQGDTIKDIGV